MELTFVDYRHDCGAHNEGVIVFQADDGQTKIVEFDTSTFCCEALQWSWNGAPPEPSTRWSVSWSFDDSNDEDGMCGGKLILTLAAGSVVKVFTWNNYHNGYYCHQIKVFDTLYWA